MSDLVLLREQHQSNDYGECFVCCDPTSSINTLIPAKWPCAVVQLADELDTARRENERLNALVRAYAKDLHALFHRDASPVFPCRDCIETHDLLNSAPAGQGGG